MDDKEFMWMLLSTCIHYADFKVTTDELVPVFEEMYEEYESKGEKKDESQY